MNKEKPYHDPLQNQKEPIECLISEVKNPSDEQPQGPSEESNKNHAVDQDKIHDGQDSPLMNVNFVNMEESLQSSLMEKVPKSLGKTSPKVRMKKSRKLQPRKRICKMLRKKTTKIGL